MTTPIVWILAIATVSVDTNGVVQRLTLEPAIQTVASGDLATVTVMYDSNDPTVTGVGFHLHYDSSKVVLEEADTLFDESFIGGGDQEDASDWDHYSATDRYFVAAWTSVL